jgi:hypothetical protein
MKMRAVILFTNVIALGRELLASLTRAWHGRLVLTASAGRASSRLRQHLLYLAETLTG